MKPYVSTLFKTPQEFEEWIQYNNHENKEALDTITAKKIDEWDKKGCNLAFDKNNGKIKLLAANGEVLATVDAVKCDEETVIRDEATGAITVKGIKDSNSGKTFNLWVGTTEAYKAIALIDPNTIYCFTDDTTLDEILETLADLNERTAALEDWQFRINVGTLRVPKASDTETFMTKPLNSFRGHGTLFEYGTLQKVNIDNYKKESYYFVVGATGTLPKGFSGNGFVNTYYTHGQKYTPHSSGDEPISIQTLLEADGSKEWIRIFNHNTSAYVNPDGVWGTWIQTRGHDIDNFSPTSFRGHGTNFSYEPLVQDNIDYKGNFEGHYFVINAKGTLPSNFCGHGFLDVEMFSGKEFAPNGKGAEKICRQTLREYNTAKTWVRTYNHNTTVSGVWTAWEQTAGDGTYTKIASRTINSDNTVDFPVGSLITLMFQYDVSVNGLVLGDNITGVIQGNARGGFCAQFADVATTLKDYNFKINGTWRFLGGVQTASGGYPMALIQRIK